MASLPLLLRQQYHENGILNCRPTLPAHVIVKEELYSCLSSLHSVSITHNGYSEFATWIILRALFCSLTFKSLSAMRPQCTSTRDMFCIHVIISADGVAPSWAGFIELGMSDFQHSKLCCTQKKHSGIILGDSTKRLALEKSVP